MTENYDEDGNWTGAMREVYCNTESCGNWQFRELPDGTLVGGITVEDDGTEVECGGGCGSTLAVQDDAKYEPPEIPKSDEQAVIEQLLARVADLEAAQPSSSDEVRATAKQ